MKKILLRLFCLSITILLVLSACDSKKTPTQAPDVSEVLPTNLPETETPLLESTPTLEPVNLAGPPIEVGSTALYVDGSIIVAVPAGEFIMGHGSDDNPEHIVYLDDFWIYRAPVTNQQYTFCVESGACEPPDLNLNESYDDPLRANDPVTGVNWEQGAEYCEFVHARYPTEAEWEKTARGPDGNIYPWGDSAPSCDLLNAADCVRQTTDVTTYPQGASYYEVLDMAGNVFEWVADWYSPIYYGESPAENPLGPETGERRSVRSSGFSTAFFQTELARRLNSKPIDARNDLGFRCVALDPMYFAPYCEQMVIYGSDASGIEPTVGKPNLTNICPNISISQAQWCGKGDTPFTNVQININPSAPITYQVLNCTDMGGGLYLCDQEQLTTICTECTLAVDNAEPQCPLGYHLDGFTCIPDQPFEGRCVPGINYDSERMCCDALPGNLPDGGGSLPPCPAGTYYYNPPGVCAALPGVGTTCKNATIGLPTCEQHGGDDPGGCINPPNCVNPATGRCGQAGLPPCCCP